EHFVRELLPVVDNLERSLEGQQMTDNIKSLLTGVELTLKMFLSTLEKFGVVQINPVGSPFDPTFHEAVSISNASDVSPNQVVQVLQKGYRLHGRLLRPAMVIVSK